MLFPQGHCGIQRLYVEKAGMPDALLMVSVEELSRISWEHKPQGVWRRINECQFVFCYSQVC